MSKNLSEHRLERTLPNTINRLERKQRQVRTLQQQGSNSVGLQITASQASFVTVPAGDFVTFDCRFESENDGVAFAKLEFSLFFDDSGTLVAIDSDPIWMLLFPFWNWTSATSSTVTVQRDLVMVQNASDFAADIYIGLRWRYAINNGTGGITTS